MESTFVYNPIFIGFVSLSFFFIVHLIIWQFKSLKGKGVILITIIALVTYLLFVAFYYFYLRFGLEKHVWVSCPLVMFFIMLYLHFYVGIDRSVSVRILGELIKARNRRLSLKELEAIYTREDMFKPRIELLVDKKWLIQRDGNYHCTAKGKYISMLAIYLKKLYSLESTG